MITASIDRPSNVVSLSIFNTNGQEFLKDLLYIVNMLFREYNFHKIKFSVIIGNKAEILYDRFIKNNNGKIVGIMEKEVFLIDNTYANEKHYEIMREEFMKTKG